MWKLISTTIVLLVILFISIRNIYLSNVGYLEKVSVMKSSYNQKFKLACQATVINTWTVFQGEECFILFKTKLQFKFVWYYYVGHPKYGKAQELQKWMICCFHQNKTGEPLFSLILHSRFANIALFRCIPGWPFWHWSFF